VPLRNFERQEPAEGRAQSLSLATKSRFCYKPKRMCALTSEWTAIAT